MMKKAFKLLLLVIVLSLSLVGCTAKKEKVEVDIDGETAKEISKEKPAKEELEQPVEDEEQQNESTEAEDKAPTSKENMAELTTNVPKKGDIGEKKTPFTAQDIKVYVGFKEQTSEGYIVSGKVTNKSKTPLTSIIATIEFNEGEDIGYVEAFDTLMPGKSRASETLSSVEIETIDIVSAQVNWLNDKGEEMFTEVDFLLGTTKTN